MKAIFLKKGLDDLAWCTEPLNEAKLAPTVSETAFSAAFLKWRQKMLAAFFSFS
ncbi:hypothetical protein ACFSC6_02605 [Rufibacter sediminis]|uniref:Uncharacterized protein n=1 Tax=Rufibacter sediminis TaxID=2762756 RepID=A0ABR6VV40_9BACT|nr:hypothetical protein [Rufibacter sediminis]MBC3541054.1 hypothetical protein [Rufibacter sediminis]